MRERVGGHGSRVRAVVLQLNAEIAGDMRGDEDEEPEEELADRGPARDGDGTSDNSHALVLQACGLEQVPVVAVEAEDAAVEGIGDGFAGTKCCEGEGGWVGHCGERSGLEDSWLEYGCCDLNYSYLLAARLYSLCLILSELLL